MENWAEKRQIKRSINEKKAFAWKDNSLKEHEIENTRTPADRSSFVPLTLLAIEKSEQRLQRATKIRLEMNGNFFTHLRGLKNIS